MSKIKKLIFLILFFVGIILLNTHVQASGDLYLKKLDFEATINTDGSMDVIETWNIDIENTNTLYKTFELDKTKFSNISNVEVMDVTDGYEKSFSQIYREMYHVTKGCYYGLEKIDGNFEIAWGVGMDNESGQRTYKISYTVEDVISKYSDCSELYWKFVGEDFEISANEITGTIKLPTEVEDKSDIRVWGHTEDLNGEIYVTNKDTVKFNINKFRSGRFVEARIAMPNDIVSYVEKTDYSKSLQDIIDEETQWANEANARREMKKNIKIFILIAVGIICLIASIFSIKKIIKYKKMLKNLKKFEPAENYEYYRDIPKTNVSAGEALFLLKELPGQFSGTQIGPVFTATLLNLSLKKCIEFKTDENKKDNIIINILNTNNLEKLNEDEKVVFDFLLKACKDKTYISIKELQKYISTNSSKTISLKGKMEKCIENKLIVEKYLDVNEKNNYNSYILNIILNSFFLFFQIIFGSLLAALLSPYILIVIGFTCIVTIINLIENSKILKNTNLYTQNGVDESAKWKGLKNYMENFSMIDKKELPEIVLWEEYLVYATAFGIADKVLKQLKIAYPSIENTENLSSGVYIGLMMNTDFSSSFSRSISTAISSSYSSASGGGGGFSGGGGRRRRPVDGGGGR